MSMKFLHICLALALLPAVLFAQEENESNTQPLELPNMIIIRDANLDVQAGVKQFPQDPKPLTASELDSLNSLEKQQAAAIPAEPLPAGRKHEALPNAYFRGSLGRFSTVDIEGGAGFEANGYKFFANAGIDMSGGHVEKSEYNKIFAKATSDYIAPEKYWVFGGSRTRLTFDLGHNSYNLYSLAEAPQRQVFDMSLGVNTDGNHEGFDFSTGAGFNTVQMSQDNSDLSGSGIDAYLTVKNMQNKYELGGTVNIDFRSLHSDGISFIDAHLFGQLKMQNYRINLRGGINTGGGTIDKARFAPELYAGVDYLLNNDYTLRASLRSGLENPKFMQFIGRNPYMSALTEIDLPHTIADISANLLFHPVKDIGFSAEASFRTVSRSPVYVPGAKGVFQMAYADINVFELNLEGFYSFSGNDELMGNITAALTSMDYKSNAIPYIAPFSADIKYRRSWTESFGTQFGGTYVGKRYGDIENSIEIDGYFNLYAGANVELFDNFTLFANLENLLNSNIFIWQGYKERDLFARAGIFWRF